MCQFCTMVHPWNRSVVTPLVSVCVVSLNESSAQLPCRHPGQGWRPGPNPTFCSRSKNPCSGHQRTHWRPRPRPPCPPLNTNKARWALSQRGPGPSPAAPTTFWNPERAAPERLHKNTPPDSYPAACPRLLKSTLNQGGGHRSFVSSWEVSSCGLPREAGEGKAKMRQSSAAVTFQSSVPLSEFNHHPMTALEPNGMDAKSWRPQPPLPWQPHSTWLGAGSRAWPTVTHLLPRQCSENANLTVPFLPFQVLQGLPDKT